MILTKDISELIQIPNVIIYSDGRIFRNGKEKKLSIALNGYPITVFSVKNKSKTMYIHQLLLKAFVRMPNKGEECLHKNGIKTDFRLENLEWGTRKENFLDSIRHKTATVGENNAQAKLTQIEANAIRILKNTYKVKTKELKNYFNVSNATICRILTNQTYKESYGLR